MFDRDPDALSVDELGAMFRHSLEVAHELRHTGGYDPSALLAVAKQLDARGGLAGQPTPPGETSERREWALHRVGDLGGIAWSAGVPLALRTWLWERSVQTLRDAGPDRPPESVLRRYCANWSWSHSDSSQIFFEAFPPPPGVTARHDFAVTFAQQVATRVRARRDAGRGEDADALRDAARGLFDRWFDEPLDAVQEAARHQVEQAISPPSAFP